MKNKITRKNIGMFCTLECLKLIRGSSPVDYLLFMILEVPKKGYMIKIAEMQCMSDIQRVFEINKDHVILLEKL